MKKIERPKDFNEAVKRLKERQEAPLLNDTLVNVMQSGYVDSMGDVIAVMERSERQPATDINRYRQKR
ncbi:hypothetical protein V6C27_00770 [Peptococcaceae bacterium 1198_IL3148]